MMSVFFAGASTSVRTPLNLQIHFLSVCSKSNMEPLSRAGKVTPAQPSCRLQPPFFQRFDGCAEKNTLRVQDWGGCGFTGGTVCSAGLLLSGGDVGWLTGRRSLLWNRCSEISGQNSTNSEPIAPSAVTVSARVTVSEKPRSLDG